MSKALFILIATLHLMTVAVAATSDEPDRIALTLVFDARWSCGNDLPELRTLARQGIGGLELGDCVEILTAHSSKPRIRLAQTTHRSTPSQVNTVNSVLSGIHVGFLSDAQMSRALAMALDRLESTCSKQDYQKAMVIVLSDGHLTNSDVASVLKLAAEFRQRSWPLYITGDRSTNRNLLIAANRGTINWSSIGDANPALWLKQARASLLPEFENKARQEKNTGPAEVFMKRPSPLGQAPLRTIRRPPTMLPERPATEITTGEPKPAQEGFTTRSRTELEVTFSGGSSPASATTPTEPSPQKEAPVAPSAPEEPNRASEVVEATKNDQEKTGPKPTQPIWGPAKRWLGRVCPWLLMGLCALPIMAVGYIFARGSRKAEQLRKRLQRYLKTKKSSNDGMVVATINGQARHLGRLSRLRKIHIGSGIKNTIRIPDKGVSNRHLCLYQKAGKLMVQNLSGNPVTVGGLAMTPKVKRTVVLPSVIDLTDSVKLRLRMAQPNNGTADQRSENHGQNEQQ